MVSNDVTDGKVKKHLELHKSGYLLGVLPLLLAMGGMTTYLHATFARATDVQRIEKKVDMQTVLLLKREIRSLKVRIRNNPEDDDLQEDLEEHRDHLCVLVPQDRECKV